MSKSPYQKVKEWRERNPEKWRAQHVVYQNLRNKSIAKGKCFCGNAKVEAHHTDYSKPLKIIWLCKKHHIEADKKRRKEDSNSLSTGKVLQ